jgi:hypothetical protein
MVLFAFTEFVFLWYSHREVDIAVAVNLSVPGRRGRWFLMYVLADVQAKSPAPESGAFDFGWNVADYMGLLAPAAVSAATVTSATVSAA